ncbi:MAG: universal stress protein [Balneolaceae bacterium]|nr:universal stress protein [Balneolaceae bacterium]
MHTFKKILVPTDFSDNSKKAFSFAKTIAEKYDAKIDFLHVIPSLQYFHVSMDALELPLDMNADVYPKIQEDSKHRLQELMNDHLDDEHRGNAIVQIAPKPSTAITEHAKEKDYDLIIVGSRGADETSMLRGSTAEKVIRHSEVPVLALTEKASADQLKRILFPTDGSFLSFRALPLALSLATIYDADLTLLHVVELYGGAMAYHQQSPYKTEEQNVYKTLIKNLTEFLEDESRDQVSLRRGEEPFTDQLVFQDGASSVTINIKTEVRRAISAYREIEEYAGDNTDLVVMASHGHTGLARFFLGSTTEHVSRHLNKPVLVAKPSDDLK